MRYLKARWLMRLIVRADKLALDLGLPDISDSLRSAETELAWWMDHRH